MVARRVATVEVAEPSLEDLSNSAVSAPAPSQFGQLSYSQQYNHLFSRMPLDVRKPVPKPSPDAQRVRRSAGCRGLLPSGCGDMCMLRQVKVSCTSQAGF